MSKISFSIQYAGLTLQIAKNDQGEEVTPLKPITDLFGLKWETQRRKFTDSAYLTKRLGICLTLMGGADGQNREQTCILLSRVSAFLMSINPERVSANGNNDGAEFLIAKQEEWDDALHDYEELGLAINLNHAKTQEVLRRHRMSFAQLIAIKSKTPDEVDRRALGSLIEKMAGELGLPYQREIPA